MHSGTMHLFAINGLHIGVVALARACGARRCFPVSAAVAALVTLAVLWLDVDTTGASPSAVRAFLLVAAYEAGFVLRRPANGLAALGAAALVVLLIEPLALFSASFQMSYGVVLTILCFGRAAGRTTGGPVAPVRVVAGGDLEQGATPAHQRPCGGRRSAGIGIAATLVSAVTGRRFPRVHPGALATTSCWCPWPMLVITAGFASVATGLAGLVWLNSLFNHAADAGAGGNRWPHPPGASRARSVVAGAMARAVGPERWRWRAALAAGLAATRALGGAPRRVGGRRWRWSR